MLERTLVMLQRELAEHPRGPDITAALAAGFVGAMRELICASTPRPTRSRATRAAPTRTRPVSAPSSATPPPES